MQQALNLKLEIKALSDREFEGYGSVFNVFDLVGDVVAPGAFKVSLAEHAASGTMPLMLWMHHPDKVAGAWLSMAEDSKGLAVKGQLADTELGNEIRTLLKMQAFRGLSIGFRTRDAEWIDDEERGIYRVIKEVDLVEVSLVSLAANPLADVTSVKSRLSAIGEYVPTRREFEAVLRKSGYSRSTSEGIVCKVFGSGLPTGAGDLRDHQGEPDLSELEATATKFLGALGKAAEQTKLDEPVKLPFWRT